MNCLTKNGLPPVFFGIARASAVSGGDLQAVVDELESGDAGRRARGRCSPPRGRLFWSSSSATMKDGSGSLRCRDSAAEEQRLHAPPRARMLVTRPRLAESTHCRSSRNTASGWACRANTDTKSVEVEDEAVLGLDRAERGDRRLLADDVLQRREDVADDLPVGPEGVTGWRPATRMILSSLSERSCLTSVSNAWTMAL